MDIDKAYEIKDLLNFKDKISSFAHLEYSNRSENSHKFYRIEISNDGANHRLVAFWGRIGTAGSLQVKFAGSRGMCQSQLKILMQEKLNKGYVLVKKG